MQGGAVPAQVLLGLSALAQRLSFRVREQGRMDAARVQIQVVRG